MSRFRSRKFVIQALCAYALAMLVGEFVLSAHAGLRGIGKYCGVVIFDRWDTCFLLSGPYITYISEDVKDELRPYAGKAMQVDATDVFQAMNPGDALIRKYKIVGPAPDTREFATLDGLELIAESKFGSGGSATFLIEIRNSGYSPVEVDSSGIGPTLMGVRSEFPFEPSDGRSTAVITRGDLTHPSSVARTIDGKEIFAAYTVDPQSCPPEVFTLEPGQSMRTRITFTAPPGQYQFLFGYGGGVHAEKSLASNAISFDISN